MRENIFKKTIPGIALTATFILSASLANPEEVYAAKLENGVTLQAIDASGQEALPLTSVEFEPGETAEDVFKRAASQTSTPFEGEVQDYGLYVDTIGEETADGENNEFWSLIENGESASLGVSDLEVENGDNIRFSLQDWTQPANIITTTLSALDAEGNYIIEETPLELPEYSTAHDALNTASKASQVPLALSVDDEFHAAVDNIGDVALAEGDYWSFFVNNEMAPVGISSYVLKEGDKISFIVDNFLEENPEEAPTEDKNQESAPPTTEIQDINYQATIQYAKENLDQLSYGNEWEVIGLLNSGETIPDGYAESLAQAVQENDGQLPSLDNQKAIIALSLLGQDASDFAGYDLVAGVEDNLENANSHLLINAKVYSLLAFDSGQYPITDGLRESLINDIIDSQLPDGGFAYFGDEASADITGMALAALAPYQDRPEVQDAIDQAVAYLSQAQDQEGGYPDPFSGGDSSEAVSQVIIGLSTVGIDPTGPDFTKSGGDLIQHLSKFQLDDGSFVHLLGDTQAPNDMPTQQALMAQAAYANFLDQAGSIYVGEGVETPGKQDSDGNQEGVSPGEDSQETPVDQDSDEGTPTEQGQADSANQGEDPEDTANHGQDQIDDSIQDGGGHSIAAGHSTDQSNQAKATAEVANPDDIQVLPQTGQSQDGLALATACIGLGTLASFQRRKNQQFSA